MGAQNKTITMVVAGDVTLDWNIARIPRRSAIGAGWNPDDATCAFCQRGGAAMLGDLIEAATEHLKKSGQADVALSQIGKPQGSPAPNDKGAHHSYTIWEPFDHDTRNPKGGQVWRVRQFLGIHRAMPDTPSPSESQKVVDDSPSPDLIVLADDGFGFRDHPDLWPEGLLQEAIKPWIILKMAGPVCEGALWDHLVNNHADRLIVVLTADDLRRGQVRVSSRVSWERTAQDLVWELSYNHHVNSLLRSTHVIVSFGPSGTILLTREPDGTLDASLFFDPQVMEGEWALHYKGSMIGYASCLTAGLAREVILDSSAPNIAQGIQSGVQAMRALHMEGYGPISGNLQEIELTLPAPHLATILAQDSTPLAVAGIPIPVPVCHGLNGGSSGAAQVPPHWTILEQQQQGPLEDIAQQIIREGLDRSLTDVPITRFGKLATVDRREIEALCSISGLIREYSQGHQSNPLSIAVFGPPGAGKSFSVTQVASSVLSTDIKPLTFNISQFGGPDDLLDAFHQVRDKALSGEIPLVFWDEFDTPLHGQPFGWLRYFLSPMQDGKFLEGQIVHPIGRGVFVFAGGTCSSMEAFDASLDGQARKEAKLPDFISRLKGFLDILGPNGQQSQGASQAEDRHYVIRRAIVLRSMFERNVPQILHGDGTGHIVHIDQGVLRAFLMTREYKHGARSMEAIVGMSQLAGRMSFDPSSLPPESLLNLHVDSHDFLARVHSLELEGDLLERLAAAAHEIYCENMIAQDDHYGPETLEDKKVNGSLVSYCDLPDEEKDQNRNNVRDIPNKLATMGYTMLPARGNEPSGEFSIDEIETLGETEHERWMQQKLDEGWEFAEKTDKSKKVHQCLVPWEKLVEEEREKDRVLVRGIPRILAKAGYTMVRFSQESGN